ncbi:protein unc-93 A-like isoform X1 [Biomphalaria glabrata]|nr:protein unc-93-like protein A-like isoform X1 [Biomphalaria glabrata]
MSCLADDRRKLDDGLKGREIRNTIVVTFSFTIVFSAFNALQNLHSSVHEEDRLGLISLAVLYFTSTLTSVFSPTIISRVGARTVMVVYFFCHCLYVAVNFYPTFATMLPAAALVGSLFGPAWTAQSLYITVNADSFSKGRKTSPFVIMKRFQWCFFAGLASSQVLGNAVSGMVLHQHHLETETNSSEDGVIKSCGVYDCHKYQNLTESEDPHGKALTVIMSVYIICTAIGVAMVISLLPPLPRRDWITTVSVKDSVVSCCSVLFTLDTLLLVPFVFYTAVQNAFLIGTYTTSYVSCPLGLYMVGYVMSAYGVTTPILSIAIYNLSKLIKSFICLLLAMGAHITLLVILFFWAPDEDSTIHIFVVPVVWGASECIILTQATTMISNHNNNNAGHKFANFYTWRSLGYCLAFLCATYLCVSITIVLTLICAVLALVLYVVVEFKHLLTKREVCVSEIDVSVSSSNDDVNGVDRQIDLPTVNSPLMSLQERSVFDYPELNDVIKEAQSNWRRGSNGPRLDIKRAMSHKHLQDSQAMRLYHSRHLATVGDSQGITRSFSDSHVKSLPSRQGAPSSSSIRGSSSKSSRLSELNNCEAHFDPLLEVSVADNVGTEEDIEDTVEKKIFHIDSDSEAGDLISDLHLENRHYLRHILDPLCSPQHHEIDYNGLLNFELLVESPKCSNQSNKATLESGNHVELATNQRNGDMCSKQNEAFIQSAVPADCGYVSEEKDVIGSNQESDSLSSPTSPPKYPQRRSLKRRSKSSFRSIASSISAASFRFSKSFRQISRTSSHRSGKRSGDSTSMDADSNGFVPEDDDSVIDAFKPKRNRSRKTDPDEKDSISIY